MGSTVNHESIKIAESISRVRELATERENAAKKVTLDQSTIIAANGGRFTILDQSLEILPTQQSPFSLHPHLRASKRNGLGVKFSLAPQQQFQTLKDPSMNTFSASNLIPHSVRESSCFNSRKRDEEEDEDEGGDGKRLNVSMNSRLDVSGIKAITV